MGRYATIKREFMFLAKTYGFDIYMKQKRGSWYFITWRNTNKKIKVLYNELAEQDPITIFIYDSNSLGFDADEYINEFDQRSGSPREKIHRAAEWLKKAIEEKRITV
ncbi:MAG: hypothetical protein IJK77_02085 [Lachnospiraceae bacterium]|nr:hypothetical protein [Lachnospiraceae bacterium]